MALWGEDDTEGRWLQGVCAVLLLPFALVALYLTIHATVLMYRLGGIGLGYYSVRLCWRCAYYAATGKNNVNRDDY
jgi:hypothetical protein